MKHIGGGGKARGEAAKDGGVGEIFGEQGFADAVGTKEDSLGGLVEELKREELIDEGAVDFGGPVLTGIQKRG